MAFGEQVPADDEDGVADGDGGPLLADAAGEPPELGRQVVVAAGALRNTPLALSASTSGSRSPETRALGIRRPDTPRMSEATTPSLMPASSRVFSIV